ncbi:MAG: sigma factor-like helix-turn-helix DNA-binding protein [Planctomycetia bacterium]|nr:sigma factor-like helix-turn-helix DNA-binding protein [Planctomycetia bacterium]
MLLESALMKTDNYSNWTVKDFVEAIRQNNDFDAFNAVFSYAKSAMGYNAEKVRRYSIMQEDIYNRLWEKIKEISNEDVLKIEDFAKWIFCKSCDIIREIAAKEGKHQHFFNQELDVFFNDEKYPEILVYEDEEYVQNLFEQLWQTNPRGAYILLFHRQNELKHEKIAEILGLSSVNVRQIYSRTKTQLTSLARKTQFLD